MVDFGRSDDPKVQAQLNRLDRLSVPQGRLGLETINALMDRLGNPHRKLPPVFHVAGTNGKGSSCAFLRAILEADGKRVHVTTSPHLVRYNERIRLAGELISDEALANLLKEVLDASADIGPSFFEVTIASAFLAFSRTPADACIVEVGLGGRFDATNVLGTDALAACGITALGLDHEKFLLSPEEGVPTQPMARIAFEKAGIAKPDVPLITLEGAHPSEAHQAIRNVVERVGAHHLTARIGDKSRLYCDVHGDLTLPAPAMYGPHQGQNAALAVAMLRHQSKLSVSDKAIVQGIQNAHWPARMQRLGEGPLTALTSNRPIWLDGGHNPNAGAALAKAIAEVIDGPLHLILGMLANKDPNALISPLSRHVSSLTAVPVPHHESHDAASFGPDAKSADDLQSALQNLPTDGRPVLIAGSLYLAGEAVRLNEEGPE